MTLDAVQRDLGLGPNGGLVYAMEYIVANLDWLQDRLRPLLESGTYVLFDCPGQVELFNVHDALHKIVTCLTNKLRIRCARAAFMPLFFCEARSVVPATHRRAVWLSSGVGRARVRGPREQVDGRALGGQPPVR